MQWYDSVFELIDMRSFSNLWFWIALAVTWSSASHWVLGVPYDLIMRARRLGGQAEEDLRDIVRINVNRLLHIADVSGLWLLGIACCVLTMLALLGFVYRMEFAQAVFLLMLPMSLVGALRLRAARNIALGETDTETLVRRLNNHRRVTQVIGMISIFVTALWGMYQNLHIGALG